MLLYNMLLKMTSPNGVSYSHCQSCSLDVRQILRTLQCRLAVSSSQPECPYTMVQQPTAACIIHETSIASRMRRMSQDESRCEEKVDEYPA